MQPFFFLETAIHHPDLPAALRALPCSLALIHGMIPVVTGEGITA
jgi:hypothetical protein